MGYANLLRKWITQYQRQTMATPPAGLLAQASVPALISVVTVDACREPMTMSKRESEAVTATNIEIEVAQTIVRLRGTVDSEQLRTVLSCLGPRP